MFTVCFDFATVVALHFTTSDNLNGSWQSATTLHYIIQARDDRYPQSSKLCNFYIRFTSITHLHLTDSKPSLLKPNHQQLHSTDSKCRLTYLNSDYKFYLCLYNYCTQYISLCLVNLRVSVESYVCSILFLGSDLVLPTTSISTQSKFPIF